MIRVLKYQTNMACQFGNRAVTGIFSIDYHLSKGRCQEAVKMFDQGRLPGSIFSYEGNKFSCVDQQAD